MKKSILKLGKVLNKTQQKTVAGGGSVFTGPCFEWCADPDLQEMYYKPLFCYCRNGGGGNPPGNPGGGGPQDPV
ncbi:hypothetical protein [uncultured Tenacibaculum sp.]|uniref:hypothetical protein n=1 Tax=uncultured Tenacibaculum sp. TaxID=174713 RepID=UPI0026177838|nr:hypothetical protein [uncultured Tenacibaculum sp.]